MFSEGDTCDGVTLFEQEIRRLGERFLSQRT
jgi:hypothetical protein